MNVRTPPFDDPKVREAVNWGVDKPALARLFAGEIAPGCSFLPPGVPGYDADLDVKDCPWGDPNKPPDLEKARQLIKESGTTGDEVTVWGNNDDPTPQVTEAYADMLNQIGLKATPKIVDGGVYFADDRQRQDRAADRVRELVPGLPAPEELLLPRRREVDPADEQPELRERRRPGDHRRASPTSTSSRRSPTRSPTSGRTSTASWSSAAWIVAVRPPQAGDVPVRADGLRQLPLFHPVYFNDYSSWCLK